MTPNHVFRILEIIGSALAQTLGPSCEVLLHNTANPDKSIIWIEGNVTGRHVGGPMTNIGLDALRSETPEDLINYGTQTPDGRTLKSSTIYLRDEQGKIFGIFCLNIDLSSYSELRRQLDEFLTPSRQLTTTKSFSPNLNALLETMIEESLRQFQAISGTPTRQERLKLVAHLEQKGFFRMRKSVQVLAQRLNVSRYTLYNDLKQIGGGENDRHAEFHKI